MASKIDPSGINPSYPVASTNQSSQGFRDNFKSIQNNLVQAKNELTLILGTTITVSGDGIDTFTSTSVQVGAGNIPLEINLSNQSGVAAGSYDTLTDMISFTVNSNGVITALSKDSALNAVDTSKIWNILRNQDDSSYPGNAGLSSIVYPTFQTNQGGRVISSGSVSVQNIGLMGYNMPKGYLLVGSNQSKSTFQTPGSDNQVLVANSNSSTGLSWSTPTGGTVTGVSTGPGLKVSNANSTPEVDLDIGSLPQNNTFDNSLVFLSYINNNHSITNWGNLSSQITNLIGGQGYLKHVKDDPNPALGGTLDASGQKITDNTGTLTLASSSGRSVLLTSDTGIQITSPNTVVNGYKFPNTIPTSTGYLLTSDTNGNLSWTNPGALTASVRSADSSLTVTNSGAAYTVQFSPWNIPGIDNSSNPYKVLVVDPSNNNARLATLSDISSFDTNTPSCIFVSPAGSSNGNGTIFNPYNSLSTAISNGAGKTVFLYPGTYGDSPNINVSSVTIKAVSTKDTVQLSGTFTLNNGTGNTVFSDVTFTAGTAFNIPAGVDNMIVRNCDSTSGTFINQTNGGANTNIKIIDSRINGSITVQSNTGSLDIEGCNRVGNIVSSINTIVSNTTQLGSITHNSNTFTIQNVGAMGGITSTSNNTDDTLIVRNTSLSNNDGTWNSINKTGGCGFILQNVDRLATQDNLQGTRISFDNTDDDIGDQVEFINASGNITLDAKTRVYDVTVNTANAFSITVNTDNFDSSKYIRSMTVILRGTSNSAGFGNNAITWNNVTWTTGNQPGWNYNNGKATIFTLLWINGIGWIGGQSLITA